MISFSLRKIIKKQISLLLLSPSNPNKRMSGFLLYTFSNQKNERDPYCLSGTEESHTTIQVSERDIQIIRKMIEANQKGLDFQLEGQENFFASEQTKLSLQVLQLENLQQIKPLIAQYSTKQLKNSESPQKNKQAWAQLLRCKFIILYKYINLKGSIVSPDILPIYQQLAANVHSLDEQFLTQFYRIIANEIVSNKHSLLLSQVPPLPRILVPSHTNSELLSLLLMVYPMNEDQLYINYHLLQRTGQTSLGEGQADYGKLIIYDPVHLMHILKHMYYYEDVQRLVGRALSIEKVDEDKYHFDPTIRDDQQLRNRQIEAVCHALEQGYYQLCIDYLFTSRLLLASITLTNAQKLLAAILSAKEADKYPMSEVKTTLKSLLRVLGAKQESVVQFSEEEQLEQNQIYGKVVQVLTLMLTKGRQYLQLQQAAQLIEKVFRMGNMQWRIKYQQFSASELFKILVCYKGCKDYLAQKQSRVIDSSSQLLRTLLYNFKEELEALPEINEKEVFYVCYFADSFDCLDFLKTDTVVNALKRFAQGKGLNARASQLCQILLHKLNKP